MISRLLLFIIILFFFSCNNEKKEKVVLVPQNKIENIRNEKIEQKPTQYQDGDIIFQTSTSSQSKAIQIATKSKYSHVGILYLKKKINRYVVFEAVQPVKSTPLEEWIKRGDKQHYVVKRLINAKTTLTPEIFSKIKNEGKKFIGKNYDLYFSWSDENIYCSELVWKIYKRAANIELGELQELGDLDLSDSIVKAKLIERYGKDIPLNEKVISPEAIYNSELLETIFEN
jgi:uncharacterized protein YycO